MNVIFGSVVYGELNIIFKEFIQSLNAQTYGQYKLLLINEGIPQYKLKAYLSEYIGEYCVINAPSGETPVGHRIRLIESAFEMNADLLIIGDSDDLFSCDRIEKTVKEYVDGGDYAFYYNKLIGMRGEDIMPDFPKTINNAEGIAEHNFLGMSNTSINIKRLDKMFIQSLHECSSPIFDWYLYTRLLLEKGKGKIISGAHTIYRIYDKNIAGIRNAARENVEYEIRIKKMHYHMLSKYEVMYKELLEKYQHLNIDDYICDGKKVHYWWDLIRVRGSA